jgi:transcriptional regulator
MADTELLVLRALAVEPQHGYAVAEWIRETTDDALQIEDGALYTALHRMEKRRWLDARWGLSGNNRRAKFYRLTAKGRRQLDKRTRAWNNYAAAVFKVLGDGAAK